MELQSFGGSGVNLTASHPGPHNVEPLPLLLYPVTSSSLGPAPYWPSISSTQPKGLGLGKLKHTHTHTDKRRERETTPTTYLCYITIPLPTHAPICSPVSHQWHRHSSSTQQNFSWPRFFWGDSRTAADIKSPETLLTWNSEISQMDFSQNRTPGDDREVCFEGGPLIVVQALTSQPTKR